jgi:hypothetical protein
VRQSEEEGQHKKNNSNKADLHLSGSLALRLCDKLGAS